LVFKIIEQKNHFPEGVAGMKHFMEYFCLSFFTILLIAGCDSADRPEWQLESEKSMATRTVYSTSPDDIWRLFDEVGYTKEAWQSGIREVPRIYLTGIPQRWGKGSDAMPVVKKKALFFRLLAPAVLRANEIIAVERKKFMELKQKYPNLTGKEKSVLAALARKYKVSKQDAVEVSKENLAELLLRVETIPVSLALAQGAEESGWGTSRFALLGNSLFGQWDFSGKGITPKRQRKELGNYGLARFDYPQDAVNAYMLNLNTHNAYAEMRVIRARLRKGGKKVTGHELAKTLDRYSERGEAYVTGLHSLMRINKLAYTDDAYLWDKEVIYITPKE
jgi:Bax protein